MCLTSTNFTLKKKFTAVHFVKGLLFSFFVGFFFPVCVFFFFRLFVCLFACFFLCTGEFKIQCWGLSCLYFFGVPRGGIVPGLWVCEWSSPARGGRSGAAGWYERRRRAQRCGRRVPVQNPVVHGSGWTQSGVMHPAQMRHEGWHVCQVAFDGGRVQVVHSGTLKFFP